MKLPILIVSGTLILFISAIISGFIIENLEVAIVTTVGAMVFPILGSSILEQRVKASSEETQTH